jgi:hypothetical protein
MDGMAISEAEKREMIETLATQVMGWRDENPESSVPCWWDEANRRSRIKADWMPIDRIADAWMLVEAIGDVTIDGSFAAGARHPGVHTWVFCCEFIDSAGHVSEGVGDTAPLAICRAALKAVTK